MRNILAFFDSGHRSIVHPSASRPRVAVGWVSLGLVGVLLLLFSAAWADSPQNPHDPAQIADRIARLRAPSFRERLQAEAECRETGPAALPALNEALKSPDPELRRRAQQLIEQIEVDGVDESIDAFLAPGSTTTLPGWSLVADLVIDSPEFRAAYADILRGNTKLVRALAHPELISAELERQLQSLGTTAGNGAQGISIASTSALLLMLIHPKANTPEDLATGTGNAIRSGVMQGNNPTPPGQLLQALATRWIVMPKAGAAYVRLDIAMRLKLPEAVSPALEMLQQKSNPHQMSTAFVAIIRFGGGAEMSVVEGLLSDSFELNSGRGPNDQKNQSTQLRDLALATLIEMNHQDPSKFGMGTLNRDPDRIVTSVVVSFESDAQREAAFEKWSAWSGKNLRKYWPPPTYAEEGTCL